MYGHSIFRNLLVVAIVSIVCGGCDSSNKESSSPPIRVESSWTLYESVEELAAASDAAVIGTIGRKVRSVRDNGGDPEYTEGTPMAFFEMKVESVLKADAAGIPKRISVVVLDQDAGYVSDDQTMLAAGDSLVLFLKRISPDEAPGIGLTEDAFVPISGDNSVFELSDSTAKSRSRTRLVERAADVAIPGEQPIDPPRMAIGLDRLRALVAGK